MEIMSSQHIGLVVLATFLDDKQYHYLGNGNWLSMDRMVQSRMHYMDESEANDFVNRMEWKSNIKHIAVCSHVRVRLNERQTKDFILNPIEAIKLAVPA